MEKDRYNKDKMATYLLSHDSDYEDLFSSDLSDQEFNNYLRAIKLRAHNFFRLLPCWRSMS